MAPPVSATTASGGSTVISGRVLPVRYVIVDDDGVIQRIISNTPEKVTPRVHLGAINGEQIPLSADIAARYEKDIAKLNMERPADYARKPPVGPSPLQYAGTHLKRLGVTALLKGVSQIKLPRLSVL